MGCGTLKLGPTTLSLHYPPASLALTWTPVVATTNRPPPTIIPGMSSAAEGKPATANGSGGPAGPGGCAGAAPDGGLRKAGGLLPCSRVRPPARPLACCRRCTAGGGGGGGGKRLVEGLGRGGGGRGFGERVLTATVAAADGLGRGGGGRCPLCCCCCNFAADCCPGGGGLGCSRSGGTWPDAGSAATAAARPCGRAWLLPSSASSFSAFSASAASAVPQTHLQRVGGGPR